MEKCKLIHGEGRNGNGGRGKREDVSRGREAIHKVIGARSRVSGIGMGTNVRERGLGRKRSKDGNYPTVQGGRWE